MTIQLSVVVPVFRSSASLPHLIAALEEALPRLAPTWEVILVEDCSGDGTWEVLAGLARGRPWLRAVALARNAGQHAALLCGIQRSRGDLIVTMDDDLQHPPAAIAALLAALGPDIDVVYGHPRIERHGWWRDLGSVAVKRALAATTGQRDADRTSAFRLLRGQLRDAFLAYRGASVSIDVVLAWRTSRRAFVELDFVPRAHGRSTYTLYKLVRHAVEMVTGYSVWPLRLASALGLLATVFGVGILAYALINWMVRTSPPGFTFLASIIAIFSGVQLFCLGIIGEYLARMYRRSLDCPAYAVREELGG